MGRVEVVAFSERLDREVGEDRTEPLGHPAEVVGVAASAEREVDRPVEGTQGRGVEVAAVERVHERSDAGRSLGHPRWRRSFRRWRWFHTRRKLEAYESRHELVGRE